MSSAFIYRPYQKGETIAAVATPPGEGGVAIIRISGTQALDVAARVFSGAVHTYQTHTAHFGKIVDREGRTVDEVLLLVMKAPKSYTGEDTVEIQCHGGSLITRKVLQTVIQAGARAALPGEFTFKAYMNGKLDLAQAEAVQHLIGAKNELALAAAEKHLEGALSRKIRQFQHRLVDVAAILEAWVDFPEEGLEFASLEEIVERLKGVLQDMEALSETFYEGKIVHEGLTLCLVGSPNVGKSSLMNALLGKERAIVAEIAGTTRDVLEADVRLGGLHFRLLDTAGIRETEEVVEQEGIRRSRKALEEADVILLVLDAARGVSAEDQTLLEEVPREKRVVVWNKIDLATVQVKPEGAVAVSAKTGEGLKELQRAVEESVWKKGAPSKEEVILTSSRHKEALDQAVSSLQQLIVGLQTGVSAEFLSSDMRQTLHALSAVIGTDVTEDILGAIFSKFCVGK